MSYTRANIRTEVRDRLAEDAESTSGIWTDVMINRAIKQEISALHRKGIYSREKDTSDTVVDQFDYTFPSGCYKIDLVERNWGTSAKSLWQPELGWYQNDTALYLGSRPTISYSMRISFRKKYTVLTDDVTISDIPDEKMEVVIIGTELRCLHRLAGYLGNTANWDSISKPDGVTINTINNYIQTVKKEYLDAIQTWRTSPPVKEINLVG
jgi:hypothetical protein